MPHHGEAVGVAGEEDTRTSTIVVAASNSLDPTLADPAYRCTGVADNVIINNALTAAAAVDGSVELLEGDYNTVLTLSVAVNVTFKAVGWGAVIHFNGPGNAITVAGDNVKLRDFKVVIVAGAGGAGTRPNAVYATGRTNVEITHLWTVGDLTVGEDGSFERQCGILFGINMTYSKIGFCTVENYYRVGIKLTGTLGNEVSHNEVTGNIISGCYWDGIRCDYTDNSTIRGNQITDIDLDGLALFDCAHDTLVGNTCPGNSNSGIVVSESNAITVTGNTCSGNIDYGIYMYEATGCTVTGNTCQGNGDSGIYVFLSGDNTVTGNTCSGNTGHGIYVYISTDCTVTGNTCQGNEIGINLYSATGCTVTGNTCNRNVQHGIRLSSSSDNNLIAGNTCNENDSGNTGTYDGISLSGADGNLILGNQCQLNDRWGIMVDAGSDFNKVSNNYTSGNTAGSINVNGAPCDGNEVVWNTVEEGAPVDTGTLTRGSGNFDPSADAYIAIIGAAPF